MRLAALLLLLFMVVDLTSACTCEDDGFDFGGAVSSQIAAFTTSNHINDTDSSHECFCCCRHIRTEQIVHVFIELPRAGTVQERQPHSLTVTRVPLYHPPRVTAL